MLEQTSTVQITEFSVDVFPEMGIASLQLQGDVDVVSPSGKTLTTISSRLWCVPLTLQEVSPVLAALRTAGVSERLPLSESDPPAYSTIARSGSASESASS